MDGPPAEAASPDARDRVTRKAWFQVCVVVVASATVIMVFDGVVRHLVIPRMNKTFSSWVDPIGRNSGLEHTDEDIGFATPHPGGGLLRSGYVLPESAPCNTSDCLQFLKRTAHLMQESGNPCGDFYKYVCDYWQHDHELRHTSHYVSADTVYLKLALPETLSTFLYTLNIGDWPFTATGAVDVPTEDLSYKIGVLKRNLGLDSLFGLGIDGDPMNASMLLVSVGQPRLLIERAFRSSWGHLWLDKAFQLLAQSVGKNYRVDGALSRLELKLQGFMIAEKYECWASCDTVDADALPAIAMVNWTSLFRGLLGVDARVQKVRVTSPHYLLNLFKNWNFDKADILNHIVFRIMILIFPFISDDLLFDRIATWKVSTEYKLPFEATREDQCLHTMLQVEPYMPMELVRYSYLVTLSRARITRNMLGSSFISFFVDYIADAFRLLEPTKKQLMKTIKLVQLELLSPALLRNSSTRSKYTDGIYTNNPTTPLFYFVYYFVKNSAMKRLRPLAASQSQSWTGWSLHFSDDAARLDPPFRTLQVPITAFDLMLPNDPVIELFHLPRLAFRAYRSLAEYVVRYVRRENLTDAGATLERLRVCLKTRFSEDLAETVGTLTTTQTGIDAVLDLLAARAAFRLFCDEMAVVAKTARVSGLEEDGTRQLFFVYFAASFCENASPSYLRWQLKACPESWAWMRVNLVVRNMAEFSRSFRCPTSRSRHTIRDCLMPH
ncbi:hypothetical protein HPB48_008311 [Haemaphysalis longicornis]|uniref:Peptidase M13 C-terminal domain-containing protein n=1 Tax=Haemaphysalis longicornis TaxID=44386 RepID=A0A9J6FSY9_HAELO|nr:hypothetical protein HPB48_008311 [Haemaphysalis longicornis]